MSAAISTDRVVVTCALTGVLTDPARHPVPVTTEQMAAAAREAFDAGASTAPCWSKNPPLPSSTTATERCMVPTRTRRQRPSPNTSTSNVFPSTSTPSACTTTSTGSPFIVKRRGWRHGCPVRSAGRDTNKQAAMALVSASMGASDVRSWAERKPVSTAPPRKSSFRSTRARNLRLVVMPAMTE